MLAVWSDPEPYALVNAERAAKRINQKTRQAAPLLAYAGMVEAVTAEQLQRDRDISNQRYCQHIRDHIYKNCEKAKKLVMEASRHFPDDVLMQHEAYRVKTYPHELEYDLEYWTKIIKKELDHGKKS